MAAAVSRAHIVRQPLILSSLKGKEKLPKSKGKNHRRGIPPSKEGEERDRCRMGRPMIAGNLNRAEAKVT